MGSRHLNSSRAGRNGNEQITLALTFEPRYVKRTRLRAIYVFLRRCTIIVR